MLFQFGLERSKGSGINSAECLAAIKELNLSYYDKETLLFTKYLYYDDSVQAP